jgi:hypothetical protein
MFAVFCAKQTEYLLNREGKEALETAERWLEGKATAEECSAAAYAAAYAAYAAANAANAAAYAAANAANVAAYAAANAAANAAAADAAAYAAAAAAADAAAYAAYAAADKKEEIKQQQVNYLRSLYLESLPEEQRNCWLVNACI